MKLYLKREYWPTATHGRVFLHNREIARTMESARKQPGDSPPACLPEGCYSVERLYTEQAGWHLGVMDGDGHKLARFRPSLCVKVELGSDMAPVTDWKGEGKGIFTRLATLKLQDRIFELIDAGERISLEVFSDTDQGLNLAQADTRWTEEFIL